MEIAAEIISDQTLLEKAAYYIKNVQGKVSLSVLPKIYHIFIQMSFILFLICRLENYCTLSNCFVTELKILEPGHEKMCLMSYANNKGADQPAHPRSLISAFIIRCLDSIISLDSISEISSL